jgi:hypothetical protein
MDALISTLRDMVGTYPIAAAVRKQSARYRIHKWASGITVRDGPVRASRYFQALALAATVCAGGARAASDGETQIRNELKTEAAHLLEQGDIASYDERATQLRSTGERTPAGIWKLSLFYKAPDSWPAARPDAPIWGQIESATEAYRQEHPDSASAIVGHARILVAHAWALRGSGWGRDLSDAQRRGFDTYLERARTVLDDHRDVGSRDPEWYALRIQVMNGQGARRAQIMELATQALDGEPTYQPIGYVASNAFLGKWGGSPQLLRTFIALAVAKSRSVEGTQVYARIMFNLARMDNQPVAALEQAGMDWPALKASLREVAIAYPDSWNLNIERAMTCLVGTQPDYEEAVSRLPTPYVSVAWFDTVGTWPACAARQEEARQSPVAAWAEAIFRGPASMRLVLVLTAGAVILTLVYLSRRARGIEK